MKFTVDNITDQDIKRLFADEYISLNSVVLACISNNDWRTRRACSLRRDPQQSNDQGAQ